MCDSTGAPLKQWNLKMIDYWDELCEIMEWSKQNVTSTFHICWGAQAALYYHYGIKKYPLSEKLSGVFRHRIVPEKKHKILLRGFDDEFYAPHSRHTEFKKEDIERVPELEILAESDAAGCILSPPKANASFL